MRIPSNGGTSGYAQLRAAVNAARDQHVNWTPTQTSRAASVGSATNSLGLPAATVAAITGMTEDEISGLQAYSVTGPGVTPRFSSNIDTFSMTDTAGTVVTMYASSTQPAVKGVLVRYGPGISDAAKTAATTLATTYLHQHMNDHCLGGDQWDKPVYDFHA